MADFHQPTTHVFWAYNLITHGSPIFLSTSMNCNASP